MAIDTHTHFYEPNRPQGVPWPPSDNELLYRTVEQRSLRPTAGPPTTSHDERVVSSQSRPVVMTKSVAN